MFKLSRKNLCCQIINVQHIRFAHQMNHYEVLKLKSTCTPKEIREAFIRLSKEVYNLVEQQSERHLFIYLYIDSQLHPDANLSNSNQKGSGQSFVQLLEAYKVLSKLESRISYDHTLSVQNQTTGQKIHHQPWRPTPVHYHNADPDSYYGIKGIKKVSNWKIVFYCGVFMIVGIIVQVIAISKSFTFNRDQLDAFSRKNALTHAEVRAEAEMRGNDAQIEKMKAKLNKEAIW